MTSSTTSPLGAALHLEPDERRNPAIEALLSRRSCALLRAPAPEGAELDLILDAGLRAPDHGRLRPWRFVLIRGAAREDFAELLVEALRRREAEPPPAMAERLRGRILGVPLLIAIGARIKVPGPIPEIEQLLAAGAAAMNMLVAVHALGYGAMWVTGAHVYDRSVNEALGFAWPDRLVGMLFVGTPQERLPAPRRPSRGEHVREWTGAALAPHGAAEDAANA
jgi:nitroreductase